MHGRRRKTVLSLRRGGGGGGWVGSNWNVAFALRKFTRVFPCVWICFWLLENEYHSFIRQRWKFVMSSVIITGGDIGDVFATKFLYYLSYFLPCFSTLGEDCFSNTKYKIYESVFEIIWDELFMVRNTVKTGQSYGRPLSVENRSVFIWNAIFTS